MDNYGYKRQAEHKKSFSNLQDYMNDIKFFIMTILRDNPYGIEISKLENRLFQHLNSEFDPKMFKADDFEDFLLNNFDEQIDIQI